MFSNLCMAFALIAAIFVAVVQDKVDYITLKLAVYRDISRYLRIFEFLTSST
jgi:hypothetical protein